MYSGLVCVLIIALLTLDFLVSSIRRMKGGFQDTFVELFWVAAGHSFYITRIHKVLKQPDTLGTHGLIIKL